MHLRLPDYESDCISLPCHQRNTILVVPTSQLSGLLKTQRKGKSKKCVNWEPIARATFRDGEGWMRVYICVRSEEWMKMHPQLHWMTSWSTVHKNLSCTAECPDDDFFKFGPKMSYQTNTAVLGDRECGSFSVWFYLLDDADRCQTWAVKQNLMTSSQLRHNLSPGVDWNPSQPDADTIWRFTDITNGVWTRPWTLVALPQLCFHLKLSLLFSSERKGLHFILSDIWDAVARVVFLYSLGYPSSPPLGPSC